MSPPRWGTMASTLVSCLSHLSCLSVSFITRSGRSHVKPSPGRDPCGDEVKCPGPAKCLKVAILPNRPWLQPHDRPCARTVGLTYFQILDPQKQCEIINVILSSLNNVFLAWHSHQQNTVYLLSLQFSLMIFQSR